MGKTIIEELELTEAQKSGKESLSEDQHVKIAESGWPDDDDTVKAGEEEKPDGEKTEKVEEEDQSPEALREKAAQIEKERQEKELQQKEDQEKKAKEESEKAENDRLKKLSEKTGKTVTEIQESEKAAAQQAETERLEKQAKEQGISVEEVKENEQKVANIVNNYKSDPKELARAVHARDLDKAKLQSEIETIKKEQAERQRLISEEQLESQLEERKEDIIEGYRKKYPNDSDPLSDDAVFERAKQLLKTEFNAIRDKQDKEITDKAAQKREELAQSIKPEFSEFTPAVQKILKECPDAQILNDKFSVEAVCLLERGRKFNPEHLKEIEAAAFKRGQEQAQILGERPAPGEARPKSAVKYTNSLNEEEKQRALTVYDGRKEWSDERKFHEYEKNDKDKDF